MYMVGGEFYSKGIIMNNFQVLKKKAIISSDCNMTYCFFAPITSILWNKVAGYGTMVFACGERNKYLDLAMNKAREIGADVFDIKSIPGYTDQNISQACRLFASCVQVPADTYLLTGDIDMWPLSKKYFEQQNTSKEVHLFGSNTSNHTKYPICYIGMLAETWRKIMQLNVNETLEHNIESKLDIYLKKNPSSDDGWYFDEKFFAQMLKQWDGYPNKCHMIERHWQNGVLQGRIDRSKWIFNNKTPFLVDSHVLRPGFSDENWPRLLRILNVFLPREDISFITNYKKAWDSL